MTSMPLQIVLLLLLSGHWLSVQRSQSRSPPQIGSSGEEIGSLFGVWRCDVNSSFMLLHARGLYLISLNTAILNIVHILSVCPIF
jgi:hypothetical protein